MIFDWHRSQKVQSSSHFTTYTECSGYIMAFMSLRKWVWVYTRSGLKTALGGARKNLIFSWQNWNCLGWGGATFLLRNQNLFTFLNKHQIFSIFLQQNPKIFDALRAFKLSRSAFLRKPSLMLGLRVAGSLTGACPLVGHIFSPPPAESARGLHYGK